MSDMSNDTVRLKKEILVRIVKAFLSDSFEDNARLIPFDMRPKGCEVPYRCCIYKERAALRNRVMAGLGTTLEDDDERHTLAEFVRRAVNRKRPDKDVLTVLESACQGCLPNAVFVTELCQGCVARPCVNTCRFNAIKFINGKSVIDQSKCKQCGMCMKVCPYQAIVKRIVPCENVCPVGAIAKGPSGLAKIDFDKCISCGKCVIACPFGAVHEKSQLIDVLVRIKSGMKVVAMMAPSVAGQLPCSPKQLNTALRKMGFYDVWEVAVGADVTAKHEAKDFMERMEKGDKFMTTSCCAAYNELVKKHMPEIKPFVSDTHTPLYYTAELVREKYPDSVTVFLSPC
ncbi:4Fe-4S binding protein, partial [bacterium]|nr:4Fe-4S binding protein [bacterium]